MKAVVATRYGPPEVLKIAEVEKPEPKDGFINDIDGGLTFWPKIIINDNLMLDYVDAFNLIQYSKDKIQDDSKAETSQLNEVVKHLSETSNPVLIILRNK